MRSHTTILAALLVASQHLVSAGSHRAALHLVPKNSLNPEEHLYRHVRALGGDGEVERRQSASDPMAAFTAEWEVQTEMACEKALLGLQGLASNPSGIAACYNVPFVDRPTGVFAAEVRLFNVSTPIDPWSGVQLSDIQLALSYLGASVQMMNATSPAVKRDASITWEQVTEHEVAELVQRQAPPQPTPTVILRPKNELKVLSYIGRINSNLMGSAADNQKLQPLLIPMISIQANNPVSNQPVKAVLSSTEASFVNGLFAQQAAVTPTNNAEAAASASALAATAAPLVIPGLSLGVTPVGIIVTLVWTGFFITAVGLGTLGRIQFRDQYRRRVKMDQAKSIQTF